MRGVRSQAAQTAMHRRLQGRGDDLHHQVFDRRLSRLLHAAPGRLHRKLQEDAPAPNPLKRTSADDRRKGRHAKPRAGSAVEHRIFVGCRGRLGSDAASLRLARISVRAFPGSRSRSRKAARSGRHNVGARAARRFSRASCTSISAVALSDNQPSTRGCFILDGLLPR